MEASSIVRIDKFLWAVRLFKTRSLAIEACKKGKVMMGGLPVKSSRVVKKGDVVAIKEPPIMRQYEVIGLAEKRMGAKLTPDFIKEVTPAEELEILRLTQIANTMNRGRGLGRPTKKERRDLDGFFDSGYESDD
ncbi:RNA-binding S4 domain-containing protein [Alkaliflexus imshenetskii]|jgi:ribosome-associated heat shock protein Hsp15|uniref:RNA-binding S4 domain-containing protein n=1 Tax=Alkaliflexus imshenetskii TaxID=286730 RepID=UPI000478733F|nr:S4 domain-containing protein [Alkaliflexus imshenetskii]